MRLATLVLTAILFALPSIVRAQYDFDDFLQAVESGQSKSTPAMMESPRLAQLPSGSVMIDGGVAKPVPMNVPAPPEALPIPAPVQPVPSQVNFPEVFQKEDAGLAQPVTPCSHGCQSCGRAPQECTAMSYQTPNLPAPSSLRGYFNSSPCIVNVWDGYSCEAAAACVKKQQKLMGTYGQSKGCACGKQHCD
jgi:hypothetical protein